MQNRQNAIVYRLSAWGSLLGRSAVHTRLRMRAYFISSLEAIKHPQLRSNLLQSIPFWFAAALTGVVASLYAEAFAWAEKVQKTVFHRHPWIFLGLTPVCFLASWAWVRFFAKGAGGSGIPQVMAAIELARPKYRAKIETLLGFRILLSKIISSLILVLGGGAIGREGPTIQIASSLFCVVHDWIPKSWPKIAKRNMILTGAAGGLAAAFNTPLGGIVFAVEELAKTHMGHFRTAVFTAVIIAGLTAHSLSGGYLYLGIPTLESLHWRHFLLVAFGAVLAGLLAACLGVAILRIGAWKKAGKSMRREIGILLLGSILLAVLGIWIRPEIFGSGKELMISALFSNDYQQDWNVPMLRFIGPLLSFSAGGAGGIFAPGLSAGCALGATISTWFELSVANTHLLELVCMAAFLTGLTRSPFTSSILVMEMTHGQSVVLYLIFAAMMAGAAASWVDRQSLYEHLKRGYISESIGSTQA